MGTCATVAASDWVEGLVIDACNAQGVKGGGQAQPTVRIVGIFLGKLGFAK